MDEIDGLERYKIILLTLIKSCLADSHIQFEIVTDNTNLFIFPKGVPKFDTALVSQPLEWLQAYPSAQTAWLKALKRYADGIEENASDVADLFRKALESFFQAFFGGAKSLENYVSLYGEYLKSHTIPTEISNNLPKILKLYTDFMNDYAKHTDRTSANVLEYIMYETGNIIRLLITLKQTNRSLGQPTKNQ